MMIAAFLTDSDAPSEVPLKRRLKRAERSRQIKALALVLPLLLFLLVTFAGPIAGMLWRSVDDWELRQVLPHTVAALAHWDGKDVPDEQAYAALAEDIQAARASGMWPASSSAAPSISPAQARSMAESLSFAAALCNAAAAPGS